MLGYPGDGLFSVDAEVVNAGETGYAVYLTVDPSAASPGARQVDYHFASAEQKGGPRRAGKRGDLFILGDFSTAYYRDKTTIGDPDDGFAYLFLFDTSNAVVRLHGSPSEYRLVGLDTLPVADFGSDGSAGGTAILWAETEDIIGVLVGVAAGDLTDGLSGPAFEYAGMPAPAVAQPDGVQIPNAGLLSGAKSVAAGPDGHAYLVASAPDGLSGVPGDGVLYAARFAPDGAPVWQRRIGAATLGDGARIAGDSPADLVVADGTLHVATALRAVGDPGGIAGATNRSRLYAIDTVNGSLAGLYEPTFDDGDPDAPVWSVASGVAADGAGHLYLSGERSVGESATPYLIKLRAENLKEIWRMGAYGRVDEVFGSGFEGASGASNALLIEARGGVTFWDDPGTPAGDGIAYISGYRWENLDSPMTAWVAAVRTDGRLLWRRELGDNGYEWPWATTADPEGNVYFGGFTTSRSGLHTTGSDPGRSGDGFIARLDRHGNVDWVRLVTTADGEEVRDLAFVDGRLYAIGHTFANLSASGPADEPVFGASDVWVAAFEPDGTRVDAFQVGTPRHERASFDVRDGVIHIGGARSGRCRGSRTLPASSRSCCADRPSSCSNAISVDDLERHAGVGDEAVQQLAVQRRGRGPEAAAAVVADVGGQARGGLADHLRRRSVTGIAVAGYLRAQRVAAGGASFEHGVEEPGLALLGRRPFARFRQHHLLQQRAGRAQRRAQRERAHAGRHRHRLDAAAEARAGEHGFVVAELVAVDVIQQRVGPVHDTGVDRGHDERRGPRVQRRVALRTVDVGLARALARVRRAQRVGVLENLRGGLVAPGLLDDVEHAGERAAAQPALGRPDAQPDAFQRLAETLAGVLLQKPHAQVGRNRIEAAAVHDARAAGDSRVGVPVQHRAHPRHLAGQVAVVGAALGAGRDQLGAVQRVRSDRGQHDPRAIDHRVQRRAVVAVGLDQGQFVRAFAQLGAHAFELVAAAPGQRPLQRARRAVARQQVVGDEPAGKAGRAHQHDIEFAFVAH